jgi:glycine cleavage system regulatory protein
MSTQINNNGNGPENLGSGVQELVGHEQNRYVKVSGIGQDRLGIVYKIAKVIRNNGGNIFLQRSMQVAGEFAVIVIAAFARENLSGAQKVLESFKRDSLGDDFIVFARKIKPDSIAPQEEGGTKYVVTVTGDDQTGIVEAMTLLLFQNNLNLNLMESEVSHRPFQGTPIFSSKFEITVPDEFDMAAFVDELEQYEKNTDLTIIIRKQ